MTYNDLLTIYPPPNGMNVLVACEFSGVVRDAFRGRGHHAVSCDLQPTESPGPHYQGDVRDVLYGGTLHGEWDLLVAHPPCQHLSTAGARHFPGKGYLQTAALEFVRQLMDCGIPKICIENPVSIISTRIREPDQIINPWLFGDPYQKRTCLWLAGLPWLKATHVVQGRPWAQHVTGKDRQATRSRTFPGVAAAMAAQWG